MLEATEQILIEIIRHEMGLGEQNVFIRDQTVKIPPSDELYIVVGMVDAEPLAAQTRIEEYPSRSSPVTYQQVEVNWVQLREVIQIDILSRSNAAVFRRWEIIAAMSSLYALQVQEKNNFKIGKLPQSFVNTSGTEGGSQLKKYSLVFPCLVWHKKRKDLSPDSQKYYDEFNTRVDDEDSIGAPKGIIEFNIKAGE